ncbi:hypothetical protein JHK84_047838 [Glycine max]|nr:hypothetical protein JHK86_047816 [Glycine max]KAG4943785.1 hypothetical protein JHK85_048431 [Glycine max]KAG5102869.1 hypothetical protein JHK84_047838 [Glycine max]
MKGRVLRSKAMNGGSVVGKNSYEGAREISAAEIMTVEKTKGSKIGATLWQELFTELRDELQCGSSYLIQNLRIVDNQSEYRVSLVPYLLTKSSLMLHGVMTVVLTVQPHLIYQKVARLAVLAIPV